jgi:single-strand DNA-binding protein
MNCITIAGQLGKDAETRYLPNGDPVASFSVADSQGKDKDPIWWRCSLFGKRAESLSQYLTKGQSVTVVGTVTQRSYTDKQGQQATAVEVRVQDVALQGGRKDSAGIPSHPASARAKNEPAPKPRTGGSGFDDMGSDLPF